MQRKVWQDEVLKSYRNGFCCPLESAVIENFTLERALDIFEQPDFFTDDEILEISRYCVLSCLDCDTKELTILSPRPSLAFKAMEEVGMNGVVLFDGRQFVRQEILGTSGKTLNEMKGINRSKRIKSGIYVQSLVDLTEPEISLLTDIAARENLPLYISFLTTLDEAGTLDKTYSKSPARVLEDFGLLDRKTKLIGCNFLDKDDAEVLAQYDVTVVLTPIADMILGRGAVNLVMLLQSGITVEVGSGISPSLDMLEQGLIAQGNTANLMYDPFCITRQQLHDIVTSKCDVDELITLVRLNKQKEKVAEIFKRRK